VPDYDAPVWMDGSDSQDAYPRTSEDKNRNKFGDHLMDFCKIFDLAILNGMCHGDEDGKYTFISPTGSSVIDYVLLSHELLAHKMQLNIGDQTLSHHLPLEFVVFTDHADGNATDDGVSKKVTKIVWEEKKRDELMNATNNEHTREVLTEATNMINENLEEAIEKFTTYLSLVSRCMQKTMKASREPCANPKWFDKECLEMKKETRRALRKYRKHKGSEDRVVFCQLRKGYKKLQKTKRNSFRDEQVKILTENSKDGIAFWEVVRRLTRKPQPTSSISLTRWQQHFEILLQAPQLDNVPNERMQAERQHGMDDYCELTDRPITKEEITEAIKHLKSNKASGWDGVPAEVLKALDIVPFMEIYLNALLDAGYFPEFWSRSIIVPIFKKGDTNLPGNYRGISLLSVVSKVFTYILNKRITEWMEECEKVSEEQAGFRAGYSTTDHIFTLLAIIQKSMSQGKGKAYVAFVDYQKAFDTVNRDSLYACLQAKGLSSKMLKMIRSMYENVLCCVRCGYDYTDFFECPAGLKQGCLLSPKLFCLFINEVAEKLRADGRHGIMLTTLIEEIFSLLFADDIALVSHTTVGLQNQLNMLSQASDRIGLVVNLEKTKIMVFRKGGHLARHERWFLNGQQLEVVNSYTYLGYTLTTKLSVDKGLEQITIKAKRKTIDIFRALWKIGCTDVKVFLRLFDLQVQPALTYAAEIWGVKEVKKIEQVHMYACKKVLSVSQKTPNSMIYGELGRHPLYINTFVKAVKYWLRLVQMPNGRFAKAAYETLKTMDERGTSTWVTSTRSILFRFGFGIVWICQGVGNQVCFIREFKQRLVDCFSQEWHDKISTSERFEHYREFKQTLEVEQYLSLIMLKYYRDAVVRFRLGVNYLACNKNRYSANVQLRTCPLCGTAEEDEVHFIFNCPDLKQLRNDYIYSCVNIPAVPIFRHVQELLRPANYVNLAKFITEAEKSRGNMN
jgi:hypothetical protein